MRTRSPRDSAITPWFGSTGADRLDVAVVRGQVDVEALIQQQREQPLHEAGLAPALDLARDPALAQHRAVHDLVDGIDDEARDLDRRIG